VTKHPRTVVEFSGGAQNRLVADRFGADGAPVLLLHGGGQTRHAWRATGDRLAAAGWCAYAMDQRGHGDSEWIADGNYGFTDFARDAAAVASALKRQHGQAPVLIGASLGGIAGLVAAGDPAAAPHPPFSRLILVDITPRVDPQGVSKVHGFMREHAQDGFASVEEAAEVVASYLPHRPRPRSNEGLRKNLRLGADGRWRWHWDPRFLDSRNVVAADRDQIERALVDAARRITVPTLLVRGAASELVRDSDIAEFLQLVPGARYVDVAGARHMVAGDRNDAFAEAILDFLLLPQAAGSPRPNHRQAIQPTS
jgi:pimeloyl-ACP methyl ester carboxylesterase